MIAQCKIYYGLHFHIFPIQFPWTVYPAGSLQVTVQSLCLKMPLYTCSYIHFHFLVSPTIKVLSIQNIKVLSIQNIKIFISIQIWTSNEGVGGTGNQIKKCSRVGSKFVKITKLVRRERRERA